MLVRFIANWKEFRIVTLKKIYKSTTVQLVFYKTITLWFPCLDGLIKILGNVRVKKACKIIGSPGTGCLSFYRCDVCIINNY